MRAGGFLPFISGRNLDSDLKFSERLFLSLRNWDPPIVQGGCEGGRARDKLSSCVTLGVVNFLSLFSPPEKTLLTEHVAGQVWAEGCSVRAPDPVERILAPLEPL